MFKHLLQMVLVVFGSMEFNLIYAIEPSIEGKFTVKSIKQLKESRLQVCIQSIEDRKNSKEQKNPKYCIVSKNLHRGIELGASYRVRGLLKQKKIGNNSYELGQLVFFLPSEQGEIPIWLLTDGYSPEQIGNYLELHNPRTDYQVF